MGRVTSGMSPHFLRSEAKHPIWVFNTDLCRQGGEKYQSAFYVYEELASNPNSTAPLSIVGQAVAELHLGRLPEAEAALTAALEKYPEDVELTANTIVLNVLTGKDTTELTSYVAPL